MTPDSSTIIDMLKQIIYDRFTVEYLYNGIRHRTITYMVRNNYITTTRVYPLNVDGWVVERVSLTDLGEAILNFKEL